MPQKESPAPRVYYAGVAGLKMFSQRSVSGSPIAELPLYDKVLRYKVEHGFAYVKVTRTGQVGWVRNADLVWRKRTPSKKSSKNSPPPQPKAEVPQPVPPVVSWLETWMVNSYPASFIPMSGGYRLLNRSFEKCWRAIRDFIWIWIT